jgi:hypothetical protein
LLKLVINDPNSMWMPKLGTERVAENSAVELRVHSDGLDIPLTTRELKP